ncbi:nucleotidyltransferase domain-containing protein [Paenibacillus sp. BK720]|uniref:nucleotidyltransferase family protein n=1 Tax=Paenibacillus sp. BK720 TaxID=2587092 RepID=UPI001420A16D|nr:nucleotidyltransferase domain-containing protein [Paenibacillus sp. BK720]NIK67214.1 putative nucleotidyltransferase [Paenibacillus sp. BK720]
MGITKMISDMVGNLKQIKGVTAIVLGGSRARGTDNPNSDIDIGIYYDSEAGLDISELRKAAAGMDDEHRENVVTETGEWGPWINGGGWLKINQFPVDFLYRDQRKVSQVIEQCINGEITMDYQPGHPHGFVNSIYLAEIALCQALWDPTGIVGQLKSRTTPYPVAFKQAVIQRFFWEAGFSLENGYKGIHKKDLSYIAGCCFRSVACLNQVLFAVNETYLMNEKGASAIVDSFSNAPSQYAHRINEIFALVTESPNDLKKALSLLREVIRDTEQLLK